LGLSGAVRFSEVLISIPVKKQKNKKAHLITLIKVMGWALLNLRKKVID
jgi:hypothetical protein